MNPDKCFPCPLFLAIIIIIIIIVVVVVVVVIVIIIIIINLFVNYYSCAATTTTFTPIDNYLIACGSSQNITFAGRTFIVDSQHSTKKSIILFIHNIYTSSTRQEPVENPKQSRQEIYLTYLQTKHFLFCGGGGFFSFTLPEHFYVFSGKICSNETTTPRDLMQRDDGAERYVRWPWILLRW
ncbi:receptor-like protein kinase THESEUS 1 [Senna tora]|uniref:Receptor-like protein kinase THESEUS 1 n=1 Tax=Senna tora TaxID=362788 RepID=A0A834WUL6_9FABA|nr:receptor-like protein kinase THESEUS 1 [Senna tora]